MNKVQKYSPEVRERTVRMVFEHQGGTQDTVGGDRLDREQDRMYRRDLAQMGEAVDCLWEESHRWYIPPQDLRSHLSNRAAEFNPFWFHHGIDLERFNLLEGFLKAAFRELYSSGAFKQQYPQTLSDWEKQVQMSILMYCAYFQAYHKSHEQYVGGGVDTISIPPSLWGCLLPHCSYCMRCFSRCYFCGSRSGRSGPSSSCSWAFTWVRGVWPWRHCSMDAGVGNRNRVEATKEEWKEG